MPNDALYVDICGITDRVCHGRENALHGFFFVYSTLFSPLHVSLLFDDFTMRYSMSHRHNCTLTRGPFYKPFELFVKYLDSCRPPNHFYIIITRTRVLH